MGAFATDDRKADHDIVLEAVKQNALSLQYASNNMKGDSTIVLEAVKGDWRALEFAYAELKADRGIIMEAVQKDGRALDLVTNQDLKSDSEILKAAARSSPESVKFAAA